MQIIPGNHDPRIAPEPRTDAEKKAWKAAQEFEQLFVNEMFKAMRAATPETSSEVSSPGKDIYEDMFYENIAKAVSKGPGLGVARAMYSSLLEQGSDALDKLRQAPRPLPRGLQDAMGEMGAFGATGAEPSAVRPVSLPRARGALDAERLDDLVEDASRATGVDSALLHSVIRAESAGRPDAVSPAGARGLMQLMPGTARDLGVRNPHDPAQSVMGGARYLAGLLDRYDGDERLALAGYNAGPGNVDRYGGVPPFRETKDYVAKVLAHRAYLQQSTGGTHGSEPEAAR